MPDTEEAWVQLDCLSRLCGANLRLPLIGHLRYVSCRCAKRHVREFLGADFMACVKRRPVNSITVSASPI